MKLKLMIKKPHYFALLSAVLLTGCAGLQGAPRQAGGELQSDQVEINAPGTDSNEVADGAYHLIVAEMAINQGLTDLAVEHYLILAKSLSDPVIAERATRIAVYGKNLEAAIEAAQRWIELAPENLEARQIIAAVYLREGQTREAAKYVAELIETSEIADEAIFSALLGVLAREENTEAVISVTREIAQIFPDRTYALYLHGMMAAQNGEPAEALEYLDKVLEKQEIDGVHQARAKVLLKLGRAHEAVRSLEKALEEKPQDQKLRLTYARLLVDIKQYESARVEFERLHQAAPDDTDLLYTLGLLSLESERLDDAKKYMLKLVEMGEREGEAQYYLGRINENAQHFGEAIEWYRRVNSGDYQFDARLRVATLLGESGKAKEAHEYLALMLKGSHSPHALVRIYLTDAELYRSVHRYSEAMEVYDTALEIVPGDKALLYARALTAEKVGRIDILEADLRTILKSEPDNANALNALGFTLADQTDRFDEAYEMITRANDLLPNNAAILDSLGWVNFRMGRYVEAIRLLREALLKLPDSEIAAHLGEVLWVSGNQVEARSVWQEALEKSPGDDFIEKVMQRYMP